jgi:hypothetical protein
MSTAAAESRSADAQARDYAAQKRAEKKTAADEIVVVAEYIVRFV